MENNTVGLRKGIWTPEEDILLRKCIESYGEGKWHLVPLRAGLNRCRKSCRLRWLNYLKPNIKRGQFTKDEVDLIFRLHKLLGNRWSLIAGRLPGRTANDVKNFWNTHIDKKLPHGETLTGRFKVRKTITHDNIVRPRPRTFFDVYLRRPHETQAPAETSQQANYVTETTHQLPSSSNEADECTRWWSNLLQMSTEIEMQDSSAGLFIDDHNRHPQGQGVVDMDDGFSDFSIGEDIWELLSFENEG